VCLLLFLGRRIAAMAYDTTVWVAFRFSNFENLRGHLGTRFPNGLDSLMAFQASGPFIGCGFVVLRIQATSRTERYRDQDSRYAIALHGHSLPRFDNRTFIPQFNSVAPGLPEVAVTERPIGQEGTDG
jgi:hypothetical protein